MILRHAALTFALILLVCLTVVPNVQAQPSGITSILGLKYPSQVELQNGVAQATVTFTVYYNYYHNPNGYLVFGVYDVDASDYAKGTASLTYDFCQSMAGTQFADAALCAIVPASSSGQEQASFTLTFNSPRQYNLRVVTFVWDSTDLTSGDVVPRSTNQENFAITVTGQAQTLISTSETQTSTGGMSSTTLPYPPHVPSAGSSWTLKGTISRLSTGSGSSAGTLNETGKYTMKIQVTDLSSDRITLSNQEDSEWYCAATDTWTCSSAYSTESHTYQYIISLNTFKVIGVGGETDVGLVGHPTWMMVNVGQLTDGGKVTQFWWVPNSNGEGDSIVDTDYSVGMQTATVMGAQLTVWRLSYSGDVIGKFHNDNGVYSKGPATETILYDPVYGIEVAYSFNSNTSGADVGNSGTWTETFSDNSQLEETNLSLTQQSTTSGQTTTTTTTTQTSSFESSWLYIGAGLVAVVIVLFVLMRRRRGPVSQAPQRASAATAPPSAAAVGGKFCMMCGSRIPATVTFCPSCGQKQT